MADKLVAEGTKKVVVEGAKKVAPKVIAHGSKVVKVAGTAATAAVTIVTSIVQEANNKIINDLCNKRHEQKAVYVRQKNSVNNLSELRQERKQNEDSLETILRKIQKEEKAILTFKNVANDETTQFMVGLGNTGHGKSTVLNRLCGDTSKYGNTGPFETNGGGQSVTQKPEHKECTINNVKSVVVDTPGYKDSGNRDDLHFNNIEKYLYGCGGVDAFLLVCNGTNVRFDGNFQLMLKEYTKYFGSTFWKHLIVILTRIEYVEKEKFVDENRGQKLQQNVHDMFDSMDDNYKIPIITIGCNDNYQVFCRSVMNAVVSISNNHSKLICDKIKSPIKKLKAQKQTLAIKIQSINNDIVPKEQRINELNDKIADMDYKLDHPERFPLVTNYSATI